MKNIIITGTYRGIGFQMEKQFAESGQRVLALSRNAAPISDLGLENITALEFDIADASNLVKLKGFLQSQFKHVDILINNAGLLVNKPFTEITRSEFKQSYDVNILGPAALIQEVLPFMNKTGHVVNISSMGEIGRAHV